jgi:hypothetical protein
MREPIHALRGPSRRVFHVFTIMAALCCMVSPAGADENGPTVTGEICMQKTFGTPVTSSNKLNCTANDIRISRAISVSPDTCIAGETIPLLTATFEINVTANARYDAGFFFRTDGTGTARGTGTQASGQCSLSMLTPPPPPNDPSLDLDGDSCGDLNAGPYEVTFEIPDVECVAAPGTNELRLPNCTSWHSNQGTQCNIGSTFTSADASQFHPDTKSKCVCDDTFTVPVTVEDATIIVTKTPNVLSVPEPGGPVTYTVDIENAAEFVSVNITSIIDDKFGNLGTNAMGFAFNTCPTLIGDTLGPGDTTSCQFTAEIQGDQGESHTNTVTVVAHQPSTGSDVQDDDDATVTFSDVFNEPSVTKTAQAVENCRVDATYQVVVTNNSEVDTLSITSLTDDMFGNIATVHAAGGGFEQVVSTTCNQTGNLFAPIAAPGSYTCNFVGRIVDTVGDCEIDHTNTVTAALTDDDGHNSSKTDDATVTVESTP